MKNLFKITTILLFISLFTMACASKKPIEVKFSPEPGPQINKIVYLEVIDKTGDLIGPNAIAKNMFTASQNGHLAINSHLPNGGNIYFNNLNKTKVVAEALKQRLSLHNIKISPVQQAEQINIVIEINKMNIDLINRDLFAEIMLNGTITKNGNTTRNTGTDTSSKLTHTFKAGGTNQKLYLLNESSAGEVLGGALDAAINNIDFSVLNKF